jgi:glycosyltransferase involved in cell wall biosynthesis
VPTEDSSQDGGEAGPRPDLSVVIPVYNEREALPLLFESLVAALEPLGVEWEVLLSDDGSKDGSDVLLDEQAAKDPRFKALHFRRNFGQTAALDAGFKHARGGFVVAMDADLQNDPQDISLLLEKAREGYDVVKGWRKDRQDPYLSRILPSRIANGIIGRATGVRLHDYGCTLTLFRREILQEINLYGEMHRFIPVYADAVGARIIEVPVRHHPRTVGESKYGIMRTFRVILDLLTVRFLLAYTTKPLYFFGRFAALAAVAGMAAWTWTAVKRLLWNLPLFTDPFFLLGAFLLMASIQFLLFGLLAEVTVRTYFESQDKPSWILRKPKEQQIPDAAPPQPGG